MSKARSYLIGFAFGTFLTGTAVLLNAPKSGKELRTDMKEKGEEFKASLTKFKSETTDLKNKIVNLSKEGKETFTTLSSEVKDSMGEWKRSVDPNLKQLQKDLEELQQKLEEAADQMNKNNTKES
ncbi:YtxH domain-containing protein [Bacillus taeanensis]|nr:YtxH domain-containing protein [Bacillus taeanensis]